VFQNCALGRTKPPMSRIGASADDDMAGWVVKSPDLGTALANFSHAVYTKGRLPLRVREAARIVIAQANECVVGC
jgi:Carboxymuconolactone decarboxylase family